MFQAIVSDLLKDAPIRRGRLVRPLSSQDSLEVEIFIMGEYLLDLALLHYGNCDSIGKAQPFVFLVSSERRIEERIVDEDQIQVRRRDDASYCLRDRVGSATPHLEKGERLIEHEV